MHSAMWITSRFGYSSGVTTKKDELIKYSEDLSLSLQDVSYTTITCNIYWN